MPMVAAAGAAGGGESDASSRSPLAMASSFGGDSDVGDSPKRPLSMDLESFSSFPDRPPVAEDVPFEDLYAKALAADPASILSTIPPDDVAVTREDPISTMAGGLPDPTPEMRPLVVDCLSAMSAPVHRVALRHEAYERDGITIADLPDAPYEAAAKKDKRKDGAAPPISLADVLVPSFPALRGEEAMPAAAEAAGTTEEGATVTGDPHRRGKEKSKGKGKGKGKDKDDGGGDVEPSRAGLYHLRTPWFSAPSPAPPFCAEAGCLEGDGPVARIGGLTMRRMAAAKGCSFAVEVKSLQFDLYAEAGAGEVPEPLFCTLALFDTASRARLSADFHFHLNTAPQLAQAFGTHVPVGPNECRSAVFSTHSRSTSVVLVLTVSKVLQGDADAGADPYTRTTGKVAAKAREKVARSLADACPRLAPLRQPLAWAMAPVFGAGGRFLLGGEVRMDALYRRKAADEAQVVQQCADLQNPRKKAPKSTLPGLFTFVGAEIAHGPAAPYLDCYHRAIDPNADAAVPAHAFNANLTQLVQTFPHNSPSVASSQKWKGSSAFRHSVYVSMVEAAFGKAKTRVNLRNVAVKVEMRDDDAANAPALRVLHGQGASAAGLVDHVFSHVHYHSKSPPLHDFVQANLPLHLKGKEHLLFTFYHVTIHKLKRKDEVVLQPCGHAVLPLVTKSNIFLEGNIYNAGGRREVSLHMLGDLKDGYLRLTDELLLDGGHDAFKVAVTIESSVHPGDPMMTAIYADTATTLNTGLQGVRLLSPPIIIEFLPVIFNRLITIMTHHPKSGAMAVTSMAMLCGVISADGVPHAALTSYTAEGMGMQSVHRPLLAALATALRGRCAPEERRNLLLFAWVPLSLAVRSLTLTLHAAGRLEGMRRGDDDGGWADAVAACVESLAGRVVRTIEARTAETAARALGTFLRDLLRVEDRGRVLRLIHVAMFAMNIPSTSKLEPQAVMLKLEVLRLVTSYRHYLPLTLPALSTGGLWQEEGEEDTAGAILTRRHFLPMLVVTHVVRTLVDAAAEDKRRAALAVINGILCAAEHDTRYTGTAPDAAPVSAFLKRSASAAAGHREGLAAEEAQATASPLATVSNEEMLHAVAATHFCFVTHLIDNYADLEEWRFLAPEDERRELCLAFLFVLKNIRVAWLNTWLDMTTTVERQRFVSWLEFCVQTYEFSSAPPALPPEKEQRMKTMEKYYKEKESQASLKRWRNTGPRTGTWGSHKESSKADDDIAEDEVGKPKERKFKGRMKTLKRNHTAMAQSLAQKAFSDGNLCEEAALVVADVTVVLLDYSARLEGSNRLGEAAELRELCGSLLVSILSSNQTVGVLKRAYPITRRFVDMHRPAVFALGSELCAKLVHAALRQCNFELAGIRTRATAFVYFMLKENFLETGDIREAIYRVTLSLSELLSNGTFTDDFHIRRALGCISRYARIDPDAAHLPHFHGAVTTFNERMASVLSNTLLITTELKKATKDLQKLGDYYAAVVECYHPAPALRYLWTESLARLHEDTENYVEAGVNRVCMAALIAEAFAVTADATVPFDFDLMSEVVPTYVRLEDTTELKGLTTSDKQFTRENLIAALEKAVSLFEKAKFFELSHLTAQFLVHIHTATLDWKRLAKVYGRLESTVTAMEDESRTVAAFFRVNMIGPAFGDAVGEYVYKMPPFTHLFSFMDSIETQLKTSIPDLTAIKDSAPAHTLNLDPKSNYVQITAIYSLDEADREGFYKRNSNLRRFHFETPFTRGGKAQGTSTEQWKRTTILEVDGAFPCNVARLRVVGQVEVEHSPLTNSIEAVSQRIIAIQKQIDSRNSKLLPQVLQGSVLLQVNAGVMEICEGFLHEKARSLWPAEQLRELQQCLEEFLATCGRGLQTSKAILGVEQGTLQAMMEEGYRELQNKMRPFLDH